MQEQIVPPPHRDRNRHQPPPATQPQSYFGREAKIGGGLLLLSRRREKRKERFDVIRSSESRHPRNDAPLALSLGAHPIEADGQMLATRRARRDPGMASR